MATFYSSSNEQRDIMRNLYLREPGHASYAESSVNGNMVYLNYPSSGPYSEMLAGSNGQPQATCVELPVSNAAYSQNSSTGGLGLSSPRIVETTYNAWREGKNEMFMQAIGSSMNGPEGLVRSSVTADIQMGLQTQLGMLSVPATQGQGLSLSLGTQIPVPSFQYRSASSDISVLNSQQSPSVNAGSCKDDNSRNKNVHPTPTAYGISSMAITVPNSKYLKAAQQLLDEVVNVRKALKNKDDKSQGMNTSAGNSGGKENDGGAKSDGTPNNNNQESTANSPPELSPSERQDLQNKITKLLAMLDEVDRRYKQYYHHMQIVVSSFDVIAGTGAAKPYTALALQTISRHFRCLRDAISGQIRSTRKSLGEEENSGGKGGGIPRLRYIDQQLRQQRAMQQLGMMQPHAWRPQRGLPETSVSVLRAWLFEHFLHPYPNDSDKLMLARQTGLTRSQVSNWFINARVRLWKPMIEEMYKEETGDAEMDSNSSSENASKGRNEVRSPENREDLQSSTAERCQTLPDTDMTRAAGGFQNKANAEDTYVNFKLLEQRPSGGDFGLLQDAFGHSDVCTIAMSVLDKITRIATLQCEEMTCTQQPL
ncbi:putative transcription factor Homeodomain-TALE-BEL family [Dioscorea sansibarensis]